MQFIDPHIHLFDRNKGNYHWLNDSNQPYWPDKAIIARDFDERDLCVDSPLTLKGFVHIEAGFNNEQPWLEIEWLEQHVKGPFKSIGHADITLGPVEFKRLIDRYKRYSSVVGVRHIFDDEAVDIVGHPNAMINLQLLAEARLLFETQVYGSDGASVDTIVKVCEANPKLVVILSHCCFAPNSTSRLTKWQNNMKRLSHCSMLYIKASGWEMADREYNEKYIEGTLKYLLTTFGIDRVVLASNFPLTLFNKPYNSLWQQYSELFIEKYVLRKLMYDNALMLYQF